MRSAVTPRQYEELVAKALEAEGYATKLGPGTRDMGVDVFAKKGTERLAVQAKMYGATTRLVNHECIMQLHGAAAYFDCTGAVIATDGKLTEDATSVAQKLNIRVMRLSATASQSKSRPMRADIDFDTIWENYVMPLAGRKLTRKDGKSNTVVSVDWAGLTRITSSEQHQFIKIEIFRLAIERVLRDGAITRDEINQLYPGRASSGITLIFAQVPLFEVTGRPQTIRLRAS